MARSCCLIATVLLLTVWGCSAAGESWEWRGEEGRGALRWRATSWKALTGGRNKGGGSA
jgi:hypothetical protein